MRTHLSPQKICRTMLPDRPTDITVENGEQMLYFF
jgi:hypothetical protein